MAMGRYIVKFPKDKFLKHHKLNNISGWKPLNTEWIGSREKFMVSPPHVDFQYMVKFPKYGANEIKIELFNCCLGMNLGLRVALYFPCTYKRKYGVITKSFLNAKSELWEMKTLICHSSRRPNLEEKMGRHEEVLKEHNIDNIFSILKSKFGEIVLHDFFRMVGFDCLIGHGDRHWTNYGVILWQKKNVLKYHLAPIYDTASGYLLEITDVNLEKIVGGGTLEEPDWYRPKKKGLCKITCKKDVKTNHIELFEYILDKNDFVKYIPDLTEPIKRFDIKLVRYLLRNSFYMRDLSIHRKFAMLKILEMRKKILMSILENKRRM